MAEIINLRTVRKRAARAAKDQEAAARRTAHGVSNEQRSQDVATRDRQRHYLDQHHVEPGEKT